MNTANNCACEGGLDCRLWPYFNPTSDNVHRIFSIDLHRCLAESSLACP